MYPSKFITLLRAMQDSVIGFFNPKRKIQKQLLDACNDSDLETFFQLLDKGANLQFYCYDKIPDPAFILKIFMTVYHNRSHIPKLVEKIGGITPELLTEKDVYHTPLMEWTICHPALGGVKQQDVIALFVEKAVNLEALNLMEHQARHSSLQGPHIEELANFALDKIQARQKVLKEQKIFSEALPLRAEPTIVKPSKFKI